MLKKIWVDPDLLENKSGIGRDAKVMMNWLSSNFQTNLIDWPNFFSNHSKYRRKFIIGLRILFGSKVTLPETFDGALYQSQLGPVLPGKSIKVWIIRLHDLFPITNPEWFNWWSRYIFRNSFKKALESNAIFLCDSATTEKVFLELSVGFQAKSYVVPCQVGSITTRQCKDCDACANIETLVGEDFYLAVGTIEPRKNYSLALDIWGSLSHDGPTLLIVGKPGWKTKNLQRKLRSGVDTRIQWIPECCDGALEILYSNCEALVSFSFAEGFDLPPMEARQRHNKPLFLSDIPVHREFHSDHAVFFSNASDFIELLKKPHRSPGFSSYTDSAKLTLDLLEDYLNSVL